MRKKNKKAATFSDVLCILVVIAVMGIGTVFAMKWTAEGLWYVYTYPARAMGAAIEHCSAPQLSLVCKANSSGMVGDCHEVSKPRTVEDFGSCFTSFVESN